LPPVLGGEVGVAEVVGGVVAEVRVAEVVGGMDAGVLVVLVEVGAAADVQGYRKPKIVHVARFWSSSLGMARTALARARKAVVVRSFMMLAESLG